jgi:hypothetical protein
MLFQETGAMAERIALFEVFDTGVFAVAELARRFAVSSSVYHCA